MFPLFWGDALTVVAGTVSAMAKYMINKGYSDQLRVDADHYAQNNGYWEFYKDGGQRHHIVLSVKTDVVRTIERAEEKA